MGIEIHLDPDLHARLMEKARDGNVDFDLILNEVVRAGLGAKVPSARTRALQPTYRLGTDRVDLTKALALADQLDDEETVRKMKDAAGR